MKKKDFATLEELYKYIFSKVLILIIGVASAFSLIYIIRGTYTKVYLHVILAVIFVPATFYFVKKNNYKIAIFIFAFWGTVFFSLTFYFSKNDYALFSIFFYIILAFILIRYPKSLYLTFTLLFILLVQFALHKLDIIHLHYSDRVMIRFFFVYLAYALFFYYPNKIRQTSEAIIFRQKKELENSNEELERANEELENSNEELERTNNELERAYQNLTRLSSLKDDLISIASHDLRSPFTSILGFCNIMLNDKGINSRNKKFVEIIKRNAQNQLTYINELLGTIENGDFELKLKKVCVNIGNMIKDLVCSYKVLAKEKNIEIKTQVNITGQYLFDYHKIYQVINNLVSNALKFTNRGGEIKVCVKEKSGYIFIHVIDNGVGVKPDQRSSLFSKKYISTNGTGSEKGTGLGLVICRNFVVAHGGKILYKENQGGGSDFYFKLPAEKCG